MTQLTTTTPDLAGIFAVQDVSRTEQLQQLFIDNYPAIREAVSDAGPSLLPQDSDRIIEGLSERIDLYHGDPSGFLEWCIAVAQDSAHIAATFLEMRADPENTESVRAAIGSILKGCDGLGVTEDTLDELEHDFWCKVLENLEEWMMPSYSTHPKRPPAQLSTRLFGAAKFAAMAWKSTRVREKARYAAWSETGSEEKCE